MKDIIVILLFVAMLVPVFRFPFIGVGLWAWTSMINLNHLMYGIASGVFFNKLAAASTIISYLFHRGSHKKPIDALGWGVFLFFIWTTITTMTAIIDPDIVWREYEKFVKIVVFFFLIRLIIHEYIQYKFVLYSLLLSIGFFAFMEGLKFIGTAGGHHIFGPDNHILGDNNHLAVGVVMIIPITLYLMKRTKSLYVKYILALLLFFDVVTVLGTYSRGGLIGLLVLGFYFLSKTKKKGLWTLIILLLVVSGGVLLPDRWFNRMDTIATAGEDASFMGRVIAWKQSTLLAIEHPFTGGGFFAVQDYGVWMELAEDFDALDFIPTSEPDPLGAHAAHSIYFQVLGDHGFIGLLLFLFICISALRYSGYIIKKTRGLPDLEWVHDLAQMLRLSLLAYFVSGAALNMAYFDLAFIYYALFSTLRTKVKVTLGDA